MDKLMKNAGLKCAASIILSVSLLALAISSILGLYFFDQGVFEPGGRDALYQNRVEGIAWDYYREALDYYREVVRLTEEGADETEIRQQTQYYREKFAEENCNYAFSISPVYEKDQKKYPSLSNYSCNDYQYSSSFLEDISIQDSVESFQYNISAWSIFQLQSGDDTGSTSKTIYDMTEISDDTDEYTTIENQDMYDHDTTEVVDEGEYYDFYPDEFYAYTDDQGEYWIVDDRHDISYNLSEDPGYQKAWKEFRDSHGENLDISQSGFWYDGVNGVFYQDIELQEIVKVSVEQFVKSDFTAENDNFYNSFFLRYIDDIIEATIPVLLVSLLLVILTTGYLIGSAGHRKGEEEITLNAFDRIPFDILLAVMCLGATAVLYLCDSYYSYFSSVEFGFVILGCVGFFALISPILMTTATRIKVSGWALFKNTLIWRGCQLLWRVVKFVCRKCVDAFRYLIHHLNLYWKYVGILFLAGFIELLAAMTGSMGAVMVIGLFELIGISLILIRALVDMNNLKKGAEELASGNTDYEIDTSHMMWEFKKHGDNLNRIKDGIQVAVEERMKSERMKTELITNVSHDIKTPLTSIISYVDLLKKEDLDNKTALEYVEVLDRQSARLKKLIQDLIDASKASTGNLTVHMEKTDMRVLLEQAMGEFSEKMEQRGLKTIITYNTDPVVVMADGQHLWRIFQNLINNIAKYAQDNTRVYIDVDSEILQQDDSGVSVRNNLLRVTFKNISKDELNLSGDELMERFVRGDSSRNTEGSGLGLSIARSLAELQGGNLEIVVDGDLFKVVLLLVRA
ncbi:MAG: sensor histidine kinase [Wujia sp.]